MEKRWREKEKHTNKGLLQPQKLVGLCFAEDWFELTYPISRTGLTGYREFLVLFW